MTEPAAVLFRHKLGALSEHMCPNCLAHMAGDTCCQRIWHICPDRQLVVEYFINVIPRPAHRSCDHCGFQP